MNEFNPDWDQMAVLVAQSQEQAAKIEQLEKKLAERSAEYLAAHITHDKGYQEGRQDAEDAHKEFVEPPPEWESIKNILDEYGLDAIAFVAEWKAAQQQTEGQEHMKHEKTFDAIGKLKDIELELHRLKNALEMANKGLDAQRPWVDLTDGDWEWVADKKETSLDTFAHGAAWAADQLKEKNT